MMGNKDFLSNINFKLKNEYGNLVSFNGQSITFRLSIKEVYFYSINDKDFNKTKMFSKKLKQKHKPQKENSQLPPNLHSFKQKLLSGNGFVVYN